MRPFGSAAKLAALVARIVIAAVLVGVAVAEIPALDAPRLPWWLLLPLVYAAERTVVHSRSKRLIRSFSLSEIPIVIGMFFATPVELLVAVAVGNLIVLFIHRGQRGLRLAFNLAQFTLVTAVSIAIFSAIVGDRFPVGPAGWVGSFAATSVAVFLAAPLIGLAMRSIGTRVDPSDERRIVCISMIGSAVNTTLALTAVIIIWYQPSAAWLAFFPATIVFLGYRSYAAQQEERAHLGMLYEASLSFHRSRNMEHAVLAAAEHARSMVDAAIGAVILFADGPEGIAYLTDVGSEEAPIVMRSVSGPAVPMEWAPLLVGEPVIHTLPVLRPGSGQGHVENGVAVPLVASDRRVLGFLVAADRLGDVDDFGKHHLELIETLAGMLTVVLEKERLEDSLQTITALKEKLEQAAKSKDQFIASISHELRTPLTAVVGLSEELARNSGDYGASDVNEFHRLIAQQSSELSYIVEDLLVAARADADAIPLHPEVIDLLQTVTHVMEGQQVVGMGEVTLDVRTQGEPTSFSDPLRVRQIIRNLLTNAARYGGADVRLTIDDRDNLPVVIVSDDGPGVPAGEERAIFEPYQRASGGRIAPASVGLGLAVSRQLARGMGGDLRYRRRHNRTEFVLELRSGTSPGGSV